jgi:hypothetical protein
MRHDIDQEVRFQRVARADSAVDGMLTPSHESLGACLS